MQRMQPDGISSWTWTASRPGRNPPTWPRNQNPGLPPGSIWPIRPLIQMGLRKGSLRDFPNTPLKGKIKLKSPGRMARSCTGKSISRKANHSPNSSVMKPPRTTGKQSQRPWAVRMIPTAISPITTRNKTTGCPFITRVACIYLFSL